MDIATARLMATLAGIKSGAIWPDLSQWAILEEAGLAQGRTLTKVAWSQIQLNSLQR